MMNRIRAMAAFSALMLILTFSASGCHMATVRQNGRAEAHVKFHGSRALDCAVKKVKAECLDTYRSGECIEYELTGCDRSIRYRNITGLGWSTGS